MGFNSTLMVLNDRLGDIAKDTELGRKIADAINMRTIEDGPVEVSPGLTVIETHHADAYVATAIGGNRSVHLGSVWPSRDIDDQDILPRLVGKKKPSLEEIKAMAKEHGFRLIVLRSKKQKLKKTG